MKKICFISSTRADYGLLRWSMSRVKEASEFQLQLVITGTHLSEKYGNTYTEIEKDGFLDNVKLSLGNIEDSQDSIVKQMALLLVKASETFKKLEPDLVVVLGDRYEIFAGAQAAFFLKIPVLHLHGGERTDGAIDDVLRHCISKLSQYHITSTEVYRQRVIQLGEHPNRVVNLGAAGLENFTRLNLLDRKDFETAIQFSLRKKNILVSFHPVTNEPESILELIEALKEFKEVGQLITMPNSDLGHAEMMESLKKYQQMNVNNVYLTESLGQLRYSSALKLVDVVVGNSSSGILEAPFVGTPTLNVGNRQKGRLTAKSVYHVPCLKEAIIEKLSELLKLETKFNSSKLYGNGLFSDQFLSLLNTLELTTPMKTFYDIEVAQ